MIDALPELIQFAGRFAGEVDRRGDLGFHQGTVVAWDSNTNANTIAIGGGTVTNIPTLSTADSIMMSVGDNVALLRFKSTYFILGRVTPPGASNAFGIRAAQANGSVSTTSTSYVDLGGPTLSNVYVGSSRRCLVFISAGIGPAANDFATVNFTVSGASTIAPSADVHAGAYIGAVGFSGSPNAVGSAGRQFLLTAADGLNQGLNTFSMRYLSWSGGNANFVFRTIIVFPF